MLVPKPNEPLGGPVSFWLICQLDTMGKMTVLGNLQWNVRYNEMLVLPLPEEPMIVGVVDNLAIIITEKQQVSSSKSGKIQAKKGWVALDGYGNENGINNGSWKEEYCESRSRCTYSCLEAGNQTTGVMIDIRLSFRKLLEYARQKTVVQSETLADIASSWSGTIYSARLLYDCRRLQALRYGSRGMRFTG